MAKNVRIVDRDRGYRALLDRLRKAEHQRNVTIGVHAAEGAAAKGSSTLADIASAHEFGIGVPERSWLRGWFDAKRSDNERTMVKFAESVVEGKNTVDNALEKMGLHFVAEDQKFIRANIPPPLKESTIARKGSSTALIDTNQFVSSIAHKVD